MKTLLKLPITSLFILVAVAVLLINTYRTRLKEVEGSRSFVVSSTLASSVQKPANNETNHQVFGANQVNQTRLIQKQVDNINSSKSLSNLTSSKSSTNLKDLPLEVIAGIKKFVFFVGYSRSGHSIIGTLMDAHPHVIVPHEFLLFQNFELLNKAPDHDWRDNLYNLLYRRSANDVDKMQADPVKGYTLRVDSLSQGTFDEYVEVIGDKSGAMTTLEYIKSKKTFMNNYRKLKEKVLVPVRIIHVLRNPFDMLATGLIIDTQGEKAYAKLKKESGPKVSIPYSRFRRDTEFKFRQFDAAVELIQNVFGEENVLELHNNDMVDDPRATLLKIFNFLEVDTTEHYLDVCAEKVFKSVSQSRDLMVWPPEQREWVERKMKKYDMFDRYTFTSD